MRRVQAVGQSERAGTAMAAAIIRPNATWPVGAGPATIPVRRQAVRAHGAAAGFPA
jgi:hypothetical protein